LVGGYQLAFLIGALFAFLAAVVAAIGVRSGTTMPAMVDEPVVAPSKALAESSV
jgi:hypothetical protein